MPLVKREGAQVSEVIYLYAHTHTECVKERERENHTYIDREKGDRENMREERLREI